MTLANDQDESSEASLAVAIDVCGIVGLVEQHHRSAPVVARSPEDILLLVCWIVLVECTGELCLVVYGDSLLWKQWSLLLGRFTQKEMLSTNAPPFSVSHAPVMALGAR